MRYGKIRVEDGNLIFFRHMIQNNLPCRDIVWAYIHREGENAEEAVKQMISNYLVIITRRKKRYQFEMTEHEAQDCLRILKLFNPEMATGFPKGGRITMQSLSNTRDLGAIATKDGRHILPRKLIRSGNLYHASMADQHVLQEDCKLKTVIDLRDQLERNERPDIVVKGVEYYHIPMIDEETISDSPKSVLGILQTNDMLKKVLEYDGDIESLIEQFCKGSVFSETMCQIYGCTAASRKWCCSLALQLRKRQSGGSDSPSSLCSWSSQRCDPGGFYTFQCVPGRRTGLYAALP